MNFNISNKEREMSDSTAGRGNSVRRETGVWFCGNCAKFHIKAGESILTLNKEEFAAFSDSVFNCLSSAITIDDIRNGTPVASGRPDAVGKGGSWQSRLMDII
jgi:hypothetical protein